jgi:hypothetical protein
METSGPLGFLNLLNKEFPESGVSTNVDLLPSIGVSYSW